MSISCADFEYICQLVRVRTGIVLAKDKMYLVESRLAPVASAANVDSLRKLVQILRQERFSSLHEFVVEAMVTTETSFFRDDYPFQALHKLMLPELFRVRQSEGKLNLWCAACSSGQEPYSIAILLREHFSQLTNSTVQLIATDISTSMLARARAGRYNQHEITRGLPSALLQKYFLPQGKDWQIKENIRQMVEFRQLNLAESWSPMPQMDIIFLRNVLIYFDIETKQTILGKVKRVLHPEGYLFLGGGETTINLDTDFEPVKFDKAVCYRLRSS
ncbi:MAG: protein-glutamate O-methyltransferase CheR [Symploca sp. SIO2E9]|nr:protein-glutamate O-methyltransferase CheR [Symploca sp. SIO2E9]